VLKRDVYLSIIKLLILNSTAFLSWLIFFFCVYLFM
jgi:hypothetical protein